MNSPLNIEHIRIVEIALPLKVPFQISGGTMRTRRSLIVELHSGGAVGYGESAPFEQPFYSPETIGSVKTLYENLLIPRIEGASFSSIEEFDAALRQGVRGNPFARCGFENAFWDLIAATRKKTYQELIAEQLAKLGVDDSSRASASRIASGVALGIPAKEDVGELTDWIEQARAEGYQRVKIKIRPGWDELPCRAAREALGGNFMLWADANASYDLALHKEALRKLDDFGMAFLEQPLHHDDLLDHAALGSIIKTPVCLDESLKSERVGRQAIACRASRIWNIKVQRVGGLLEAIRIYALAVKNGVALWGGTMPESGIGAQPILALSSFEGFKYPADVEPSSRWYEDGLDPVELTMTPDGWIDAPTAHGTAELINFAQYKKVGRIIRD